MSNYPIERDPHYKRLVLSFEKALRDYKRRLSDLRRYYLNTENPDPMRGAFIQQAAHQAEHTLSEAMAELTKFSWELTPYNKAQEHLERVECLRIAAKERIATAPRKPPTKQVMIITEFNKVSRPDNGADNECSGRPSR